MFGRYPQVRIWRTDTLSWNTRTKTPYKEVGFRICKVEGDRTYISGVGSSQTGTSITTQQLPSVFSRLQTAIAVLVRGSLDLSVWPVLPRMLL